ncbi:MAG TPA: MarR family transcriptional regulator [Candidatus Pullichristensenella avicola]|nr:MarR family transcriptional regulator [Candidatus Pullichristensenella avicola]
MEDPAALARRLILATTRMDGAYYYFARRSGVPENLLALFYALADGKPHSQKEICEDWLIPKTTVNTVVREQVAAGHMTLRAGEGREKIICLTETGRAYADRAISALCAAERAAAERTMAKHGAQFVAAVEDFTDALWNEYEARLERPKE